MIRFKDTQPNIGGSLTAILDFSYDCFFEPLKQIMLDPKQLAFIISPKLTNDKMAIKVIESVSGINYSDWLNYYSLVQNVIESLKESTVYLDDMPPKDNMEDFESYIKKTVTRHKMHARPPVIFIDEISNITSYNAKRMAEIAKELEIRVVTRDLFEEHKTIPESDLEDKADQRRRNNYKITI